jgi:hypothetical protein
MCGIGGDLPCRARSARPESGLVAFNCAALHQLHQYTRAGGVIAARQFFNGLDDAFPRRMLIGFVTMARTVLQQVEHYQLQIALLKEALASMRSLSFANVLKPAPAVVRFVTSPAAVFVMAMHARSPSY